ncbi:MAG: ABC transporter substrate-binding protein [Chloroflexota bacterium]|nr:ABC transporter substrate-binding protein [Chloroflexota bacterium]
MSMLREGFDYPLSRLDPFGDHIDPPSLAVYETIVVKGPDGAAQPALAESWTVSDDGLSWRFRIRPGLRFHSGDPCDAPAILAALEMLRWGFHGGRQLWYWDPVDTVTAEDATTLVFTLHHPYVRLPSLLWGTHTAIYNEARRATNPDNSGFTFADGTGPFRFVSYAPGRVVVERWADYPGSPARFLATGGPARLDRIEWTMQLDPADRVAALEAGAVDCIHGPNYADVARLEADSRFRVTRFSQAANAYLALNWEHTDLGFDDLRVRRALALAIDRPELVASALLGYGTPTWGPLSPGGEFYDPVVEHGRHADPVAAGRLLDEAGWVLGADGRRGRQDRRLAFECVIQDDTIHRKVAEGVRDQLRRIGVELDLKPIRTFATFYETVAAGPASFINKWLWQDPVDAAIGFTASWGRPRPNWQHAAIPALDDAYRAWLRAGTLDELQAAASLVQLLVADELPYIPLLVPQDVWVCSTRVTGWEPVPAILYPFYHRTEVAGGGG